MGLPHVKDRCAYGKVGRDGSQQSIMLVICGQLGAALGNRRFTLEAAALVLAKNI
jgi:hypothetical protein